MDCALKESQMLLCADLGNTCVKFGVFEGKELLKQWQVLISDFPELDLLWKQHGFDDPDAAIVGSVMPAAYELLAAWIRRRFTLMPLTIGREVSINMPVLLKKPNEIGADRLLNALAGYERFGGPLIIIDFGTAVTFDVISASGEYMGGAIAPGIRLSAQALAEKTALLPEVRPQARPPVIGKSTRGAISSGLYHGFLGLTSEMVRRISAELGAKPRVIATGGDAAIITPESAEIEEEVPDLTLQGLRIAYEHHVAASGSQE
jgi:type III pantothenate kinase